jgi:predicted SAM-dependent methyltransferase
MDKMKLHLGCGKRHLPGYVHVDLSTYPHIDFPNHPVDKLPMIANESVEIIYASHVLEYFTDMESISVLTEWHNKLCPGGILRIAVPDFEALVEVYKKTRQIELISGTIFGRWQTTDGNLIFHKALYNMGKLANRLFDIGFKSVRRWDWREVFVGELAGFDDYSQAYIPHMDKEDGTLISLNIEAIK